MRSVQTAATSESSNTGYPQISQIQKKGVRSSNLWNRRNLRISRPPFLERAASTRPEGLSYNARGEQWDEATSGSESFTQPGACASPAVRCQIAGALRLGRAGRRHRGERRRPPGRVRPTNWPVTSDRNRTVSSKETGSFKGRSADSALRCRGLARRYFPRGNRCLPRPGNGSSAPVTCSRRRSMPE